MNKGPVPELVPVLHKMCELVGVDYSVVDFRKDKWNRDHSWTVTQQNEFKEWFTEYVFTNRDARIKLSFARKDRASCQQFAEIFTISFGWLIRHDKREEENPQWNAQTALQSAR